MCNFVLVLLFIMSNSDQNKSIVRILLFGLLIKFQFDFARSGEWGDHVTLQAAADFVCTLL